MKNQNTKIGVDLGGTKIAAVALDQKNNEIAKRRMPAPQNDFNQTIKAITEIVETIEKDCKIKPAHTHVGISMPGSISPQSGKVQNSNSQWLNGKEIQTPLTQALKRPVKIENDANCFTLSEAKDGNGKNYTSVYGIIIGTGCGGGIVIDGKIIKGTHNTGGEWGHMPLPWKKKYEKKRLCWCGRQDCLEKWVSGPALSYDHALRTGIYQDAQIIAKNAENGDKDAIKSLEYHCDRLARAIAVILNIIDPQIIILGGGLSNIESLYQNLPKKIKNYIFADHCKIIISPPKYGDISGVRGAARLWDT